MATTNEKEIKVASGLGEATPDQVVNGATFSSESGFNQTGSYIPSAQEATYDNTNSGLEATNVQAAIDEVHDEAKAAQGTEFIATLIAGQTELIFENSEITTDSTIDFYTNIYSVNPKTVEVTSGKITMTFKAQTNNLGVKVVVK